MVQDRSILVSPLETIPNDGRDALGIHQSDIILRTAIIAGIADLRANPDMLDYVFASLPKDSLTFREYGVQSVEDAKRWFLETEIPVMMNTRVDENVIPCITISLLSSQEDFSSIGDVHYQTAQPGPDKIVSYTDQFKIKNYSASTGECVVPVGLENIYPGMVLLDSSGKRYVIHEVWDDRIVIDPGIYTDFGRSQIVSVQRTIVSLESVAFKESYQVTCHAPNEPVYLTYLHSIVTFILLRYKEELIEARGLERTTMSSGEIYLNTSFTSNIVFSRPITVIGYVRNYWPKMVKRPIETVTVDVTAASSYVTIFDPNNLPITFIAVPSVPAEIAFTNIKTGDSITTETFTLTGIGPPNATIEVYEESSNGGDPVLVGVAATDQYGRWSVKVSL